MCKFMTMFLRKERFAAGKTKLVREASLIVAVVLIERKAWVLTEI